MVDRVGSVGGNANVPSGGDNDKKIALQVLKELQQLLEKLKTDVQENHVNDLNQDLTTFLKKLDGILDKIQRAGGGDAIDRAFGISEEIGQLSFREVNKDSLSPSDQQFALGALGDVDKSLQAVINALTKH